MIRFRPADVSDRPDNTELRFITDAWARSYQRSRSAGIVSDARWFSVMIPELKAWLARPGARTVVATDTGDARGFDVYGFACGEPDVTPPIVYYVYVKEPYRRRGVARALVRALGIDPDGRLDYACATPTGDSIVFGPNDTPKYPLARHTPRRARKEPGDRT